MDAVDAHADSVLPPSLHPQPSCRALLLALLPLARYRGVLAVRLLQQFM
jgi:hypothetical protein